MRAVGADPVVPTANATDISHVVFLTGIHPRTKPCNNSTMGYIYTVYKFVI
jgi:hypothetical protein